ncbi:type I methionyl aminopeptidase [Patescibacteria group bacterium]
MVEIKSQKEIEIMIEGGKRLASVMSKLEKKVSPGVSTWEIDQLAEKEINRLGGKPSFKGYGAKDGNPFPSTICASLNDEIVHGIPSKDVILKEGDIFKIDIGMKYKELHTDMARSFAVGNISAKKRKIIRVSMESFEKGVTAMKAGDLMSKYSKAVQQHVEKKGFSVVRDLVGHGIGKELHEDPQVPNYVQKGSCNFILKPGMTFALEPMINDGTPFIVVGEDGWVFKTEDGGISAHWENTVLVTESGIEILTKY